LTNIRERAKDSLPTFYLTLVSIICSLALGYYCSTLEFGHVAERGFKGLIYLCKALATFQMILLLWHEYVMGTIFFRWVVGYLDSIIPFSVRNCAI
jgi:hypothetical protein